MHLRRLHHGVRGVQLRQVQQMRKMPNGEMPRRTDPASEIELRQRNATKDRPSK